MEEEGDLDAIRQKRMEQLQAQKGNGSGGDNQKRAEAAAKEEEMKNSVLSQVLTQEARARLSNISTANPQKGKTLEGMIVNMVRFGQINGKLSDEQFKSLLQKVSEQTKQKTTTVTFDRRRAAIDSDED